MARRITDLQIINEVTNDDQLVVIDVDDNSAGPLGTDRRVTLGTVGQLLEPYVESSTEQADRAQSLVDDFEADGSGINVTTATGEQTLVEALDQRGPVFDSVADMNAAANLTVGVKVRTLGYYAPGDGGGNDYEIVAAATGTDDGGSFIDLSELQARGLFGNCVDIKQFGADAEGSIPSSSNINLAAEFCRSSSKKIISGASDTYLLDSQIDIRSLRGADLLSTFNSTDDTFIPVLFGHRSSAAYDAEIKIGTVRSLINTADPTNPNIRCVGAKNGTFYIQKTDYLQLWADSDSSVSGDDIRSLAFCDFFSDEIRKLEIANNLQTDGNPVQWINENKFFGGRFIKIIFAPSEYRHNHNLFYGPSIEGPGSEIEINNAHDTIFKDARLEQISRIFFGENCHNNFIETSWTRQVGYSALDRVQDFVSDYTDNGVNNQVCRPQTTSLHFETMLSLPLGGGLYGANDNDAGVEGFAPGGIVKSGDNYQITANFNEFFESRLIPVSPNSGVTFESSAPWFRMIVEFYDSQGNLVTSTEDPGLLSATVGLPWDSATNRYSSTSNSNRRFFMVRGGTEAAHYKVIVRTGSGVSGNSFNYINIFGVSGKQNKREVIGAMRQRSRPFT